MPLTHLLRQFKTTQTPQSYISRLAIFSGGAANMSVLCAYTSTCSGAAICPTLILSAPSMPWRLITSKPAYWTVLSWLCESLKAPVLKKKQDLRCWGYMNVQVTGNMPAILPASWTAPQMAASAGGRHITFANKPAQWQLRAIWTQQCKCLSVHPSWPRAQHGR